MGLLPHSSQREDRIAMVAGSDVFVVGKCSHDDDAVQLIGKCYVHGMMMGEWDNCLNEDFEPSARYKIDEVMGR